MEQIYSLLLDSWSISVTFFGGFLKKMKWGFEKNEALLAYVYDYW
jgi:hypothetical protein